MDCIRIQYSDFNLQHEYLRLCTQQAGAVVLFSGLVRDFNNHCDPQSGPVETLTLQHYPGMTEQLLAGMVAEVRQRWPILGVTVIHRVGVLSPGDQIVLVGVSASHRSAAFHAAECLMDYLKTRATLWKKVRIGGREQWLSADSSDQQAAERWHPSC